MSDQIEYNVDLDLKKFKKHKKELDQSFTKTQKSSSSMISSMTSGMSKIVPAIGVGVVAYKALKFGIDEVTEGVKKFNEQAKVEATLSQTLKSTGHSAGLTADEIKALASNLQDLTTYGDEAIIGSSNLLLTFKKIGEKTFPRAQKAVLDMSNAMGGDLKGASIQLGKALNDPITGVTALSRVGVTFSDSQKDMIKKLQESNDLFGAQSIILKEVESQFQGVAQAQAMTFGGTNKQLNNIIGDFQEKIGKGFTDEMTEPLQNLVLMFKNNSGVLNSVAEDFGSIAGDILSVGTDAVTYWGNVIGSLTAKARPEILEMYNLNLKMKAKAHQLDLKYTAVELLEKKKSAKVSFQRDLADAKKLSLFKNKTILGIDLGETGEITGSHGVKSKIFTSIESGKSIEALRIIDENLKDLNPSFVTLIKSLIKSKKHIEAIQLGADKSKITEDAKATKIKEAQAEALKKAKADALAKAKQFELNVDSNVDMYLNDAKNTDNEKQQLTDNYNQNRVDNAESPTKIIQEVSYVALTHYKQQMEGSTQILNSVNSGIASMDSIFKNWSKNSLKSFGSLGSTLSSTLSGVGSGVESFTGNSLGNLIPGLNLASAGFSLVSTLGGIFGGSDSDDDSLNDISSSNAENKANIVSSSVDTIIVNADMTVYTTYIDEAGFDEMFSKQIAPRFSELVQGVY